MFEHGQLVVVFYLSWHFVRIFLSLQLFAQIRLEVVALSKGANAVSDVVTIVTKQAAVLSKHNRPPHRLERHVTHDDVITGDFTPPEMQTHTHIFG